MIKIKSVNCSPQFDAWIDLYPSEEFEKEVTDYIAMMDDVAKDLDEESLSKMEEHFLMSCKLEHMFWDQAQELTQWPDL
jgi:thiaminase/transcriptional activator TenA